ncbi:hypothetical protein MycrhDRAFT_5734 [Mycolicibacterium rhodesiae JS60]|nr:hypothetical protein MycrhDRAFT_5734 [Mycolicibacterium rhodesiae JS60]
MTRYKTWQEIPVGVAVEDIDGDLWRKTDHDGGFEWWPQQFQTSNQGWRGPKNQSFRPSDMDAPFTMVVK